MKSFSLVTATAIGWLCFAATATATSFLGSFGSFGSGNGQFINLSSIAFDNTGNILVGDGNGIQKFDLNGVFQSRIGSFGSGNGQFFNIGGLAVGRNSGNIYVADGNNQRVQILDSSGAFRSLFGTDRTSNGAFKNAFGVAVGNGGNLYVADTGNNRVQIFDSNGIFQSSLDNLFSPIGVVIDNDGNIVVADSGRVSRFDASGTPLSNFITGIASTGLALDTSGNAYISDFFNNRVQVFAPNGVLLNSFGSEGTGEGQFKSPRGIALDTSGNIYVADERNRRVQVFDANGVFQSSFGSGSFGPGFSLQSPLSIAIDNAGDILVGDNFSTIFKFNSSGEFQSTLSFREGEIFGGLASGLAIDSSGNIVVVDTNFATSRVKILDPNGVIQSSFGTDSTSNGRFQYPQGIAVDNSENMYVVDEHNNRVQVFDSNGTFLRTFGSVGSGDGQFFLPKGIALDSSGKVYVADRVNNRIQIFDSNGVFLSKFGSFGTGNGQLSNPMGVTVDNRGNIYVTELGTDRVQIFNENGAFLTTFGSPGTGNGQFRAPEGIALDAVGNIYVADRSNGRVQIFAPFVAAGSTPTNPILPTPSPGLPGFRFTNIPVVPRQTFFFDPDVAVGYDYTVTGGPLFASVLIPNALPRGDRNFLLELGSFGNFPLVAGTSFNLLGVNPNGFDRFRITGIDTNELLDPTNPVAFVTGLEFTTAGTVNVTQTPIIQNVPDVVGTPEPSSLIGLGILGGGLVLTRRRK